MTIVDTTVWVDYFRDTVTPETSWLDRELGSRRIGLTDLILCEVLQGVRSETQFRLVKRELAKLEIFATGGVVPAVAAALNYRALRARGVTVRKTIDCLIASFCIQHGHELLHHDADYEPFERFLGLRVVHP
jgi:hypothetical protein